MGIRVSIKDGTTGNKVQMELENETTVDEIIEASADHWKKDPGAYVLRWGKKLLRGETTIGTVNVLPNDVLELIPDPDGGASRAESSRGG